MFPLVHLSGAACLVLERADHLDLTVRQTHRIKRGAPRNTEFHCAHRKSFHVSDAFMKKVFESRQCGTVMFIDLLMRASQCGAGGSVANLQLIKCGLPTTFIHFVADGEANFDSAGLG